MRFLQNLTFFLILWRCNCYKILAFLPVPSKSHYILSVRLVDALARKGHTITFVTCTTRDHPPENVTEVGVKNSQQWLQDVSKTMTQANQRYFYQRIDFVGACMRQVTRMVFSDAAVQKLFSSGAQFDAVLVAEVYTTAFLALGPHFSAPVVLLTAMPLFPWTGFRLGHPGLPSWVTNVYGNRLDLTSFWGRLLNSVNFLTAIVHDKYKMLGEYRALTQEHFTNGPDLGTVLRNVDLILCNSHVSSYEASVQMPHLLEIGGYHLENPPGALPPELQRTLDLASNGVIVFAMGSHVKLALMPVKTLRVLFQTFATVNQTVLMKWETDDRVPVPPNVKLLKWIPLQAVLGHHNVKVFMTHGGVLSTIEALYYGVPVIGLPAGLDQVMNMETAQRYGYGTVLNLHSLTVDILKSALTDLIYNPSFKVNAMRRSKILKDRAVTAIDSANYWIEYIIRHKAPSKKRLPHLTYSGTSLVWYQVYASDISIVVLIIILALFRLIKN